MLLNSELQCQVYPSNYFLGIVHVLSLLKRSTQDLTNAVKQLHDRSSTSHHIPKSLTPNSSQVSDQLNNSFGIVNTIPQSKDTQAPTSLSIPKWKIPKYPDGSSRVRHLHLFMTEFSHNYFLT